MNFKTKLATSVPMKLANSEVVVVVVVFFFLVKAKQFLALGGFL